MESANELRKRVQTLVKDACLAHQFSKACNAAQVLQKYTPTSYEHRDKLWLNQLIFWNSIFRAGKPNELGSEQFGLFSILKTVGKNVVRVKFPENIKLLPVVHLSHTLSRFKQSEELAQSLILCPPLIIDSDGEKLFEVEEILSQIQRRHVSHWLTLLKGIPHHEATWKPAREFVDTDGTLTAAFQEYISDQNILSYLL